MKKIPLELIMDEKAPLLVSLRKYRAIVLDAANEIEFLTDDWDIPDELTMSELRERIIKKCIENSNDWKIKHPEDVYRTPNEKEITDLINVIFIDDIFENKDK